MAFCVCKDELGGSFSILIKGRNIVIVRRSTRSSELKLRISSSQLLFKCFVIDCDVFIKNHRQMHKPASLLPFLSPLFSLSLFSLSVSFSSILSFSSPPPAELTSLNNLGGECAIDNSRNAFRDTSIFGYFMMVQSR